MVDVAGLAEGLAEALDPRVAVFILSLFPLVEPRYAVVVGVTLLGLSPLESAAAGLAALALLSLALPPLVDAVFSLLERLAPRLGAAARLHRLLGRLEERSARRASGYVEKLKLAGLVAFVAVPLPLTGVYTGALAARALGIRGLRASLALFAGGAISVALTLAPLAAAY